MSDGTPATVLVLDDEEMVVRSLESFLTLETPWEVLTFCSPEAALERVEAGAVHVAVADFMMPAMDGLTFLRRVREVRPETTRILLTGYADKESAVRAINEAGLYHYLEKPWDNDHLKLVIRNGIERSTLLAELTARMAALDEVHGELRDFRERLVRAFL